MPLRKGRPWLGHHWSGVHKTKIGFPRSPFSQISPYPLLRLTVILRDTSQRSSKWEIRLCFELAILWHLWHSDFYSSPNYSVSGFLLSQWMHITAQGWLRAVQTLGTNISLIPHWHNAHSWVHDAEILFFLPVIIRCSDVGGCRMKLVVPIARRSLPSADLSSTQVWLFPDLI